MLLPVQVPHDAMMPPQPLGHGPQLTFAGHVVAAVHGGEPHAEGTPPPPHVVPPVHAGHVHVPPQPLLARPHIAPPSGNAHAVACGMGVHVG
jgi:hypothetical protein